MEVIIRSTEYNKRLTDPIEKSKVLHLILTKLEILSGSIPSLIDQYKQELTDLIAKTHFTLSEQLQEIDPDTREYRLISEDMKQLAGIFDDPMTRKGMNAVPGISDEEQSQFNVLNAAVDPYRSQDPVRSGGRRKPRRKSRKLRR